MAQAFQTFNTTILLKNLPPQKSIIFRLAACIGCNSFSYPTLYAFSFLLACYTLPNEDSNGKWTLCATCTSWLAIRVIPASQQPRWLPAASPLIASLMLAAPPKNHCGIWLFSCWWPYLRAQGVGQHLKMLMDGKGKIHPQNQQSLESMIVCSKCSGGLITVSVFFSEISGRKRALLRT